VQKTQYYPSGLPRKSNNGDNPGWQPYKYGGKEFVEMHGLDEYDSDARWYYPAIMRTTTPDPLAEKYYDISPYAWCANNPVKNVDPNGMWIESAWDVISLVTGAKSLVNNIRQGNVGRQ
jgi:RHS repeat-associated protein